MNVRCLLHLHEWAEVDRYAGESSCRQGKACLRCGAFNSLPGEKHVWESWRYTASGRCDGRPICVRCGRQDDAPQKPRHQWDLVEYRAPAAGEVVQSCQRCGAQEVQAVWELLKASPPLDAMAQYATLVDRLPGDRRDWYEALGTRLITVLKGEHVFRKTRQTGPSTDPLEWSSINKENFRLEERARTLAASLLGDMTYEGARILLLKSYLYNLCRPYEVTYEEPEQFSQALRSALARFGLSTSQHLEDAARRIRSGSVDDAVPITLELAADPDGQVVDLLLMIAKDQFRMARESFDDEGPLRGAAIVALEELLKKHPLVFSDPQLLDIESLPPSMTVDFPLGGVDGLLHEDYELDFSKIVAAAGAQLRKRT